ncbi:MAG: rhodanese-like domain-containing protein [Planctomycetota bacterium]|nr:rhodanese-like domain-containing protein [Planctomycetota bacterium]
MTHPHRVHPDYEVSPADAHASLSRRACVLVDCRTQPEWDLVRVPGSVHVPLDELGARADEIDVPPGVPVYVICHHGRRSLDGAMILRASGIESLKDARSVAGGIDLWSQAADTAVPRYERAPGVLRLRTP